MQLLLTLDELKIVTRVLEKCLAHAQGDEFVQKRSVANHLLDKVLERNLCLSSDELEDLSDMLRACRTELKTRIAAETDEQARAALREQQKTLEHATDKVTEACAMA